MTKSFNISLSDWVVDEILANAKNRSKKIEEYVVKGYMAEKLGKANLSEKSGILHVISGLAKLAEVQEDRKLYTN